MASALLCAAERRRARRRRWPGRTARAAGTEEGEAEEDVLVLSYDDPRYRWLENRLERQDTKRLRRLCDELGLKKANNKKVMIARLQQPDAAGRAWKLLAEEAKAPPIFTEEMMEDIREALEKEATWRRRSLGQRKQVQHRRQAASSGPESAAAAAGVQDVPIGDLATRLFPAQRADREGRASVASVKKGKEYTGRVVGVSLYDGLRIDIGAEFDALVPLDLSIDEAAAQVVAKECPIGAEVKVVIEQVDAAQARRFPIVASLASPSIRISPGSGGALLVRQGDDPEGLHALRNDMTSSPGVKAASALASAAASTEEEAADATAAGSAADGRWQHLADLPVRRPPSEVVSLNDDGSLVVVPVPEEHQGVPAGEATAAGVQAWRDFVAEETRLVSLELRCRDQLAADLSAVSEDLAAGRTPSVPTELVGMTLLPCGQRCLLARADGDRLLFQLHDGASPEGLKQWAAAQAAEHETAWDNPKSRPSVMERFARLFACRDACHARAVRFVEAQELWTLGKTWSLYDEYETSEECLKELQAELDEARQSSKELQARAD